MSQAGDPLFLQLQAGRREFLALVESVRPDLHRYCARMTGSIAEGEDVVQETLARAYYALPELEELPALRPWLFQIAHNRALDHLRRYDRRMAEPLEVIEETAASQGDDPESALGREQAIRAAVSRFLDLPPVQRSCVVLMDVLGHSLEEIAGLLGISVPAVKAALHRGRTRLRALNLGATALPPPPPSDTIVQYTALFNARDWDGVRALLADDVKLDLVSRFRRAGRRQVGNYFTNYDERFDWYLVPAWLDGREVLAVTRDPQPAAGAPAPSGQFSLPSGYFIELSLQGGRIVAIRDFRYVPYIAREAVFQRP